MNINTIKEHFSIIRDERQSAKVDYPLFDILFGSVIPPKNWGAHK